MNTCRWGALTAGDLNVLPWIRGISFMLASSAVPKTQEWMIFQLCWANCVRMYKLQINYLNRLNFAHFGKQRGEFNTVLWKISLSLSSLHNIFFPWLRCNSDVELFLAREIKRKGIIDSILSKFNAVMLLCKLVLGGCICELSGENEAATIFFFFGGGWGGGGFCFMADSDTSFVVYDGNKDFWPDLLIMWCDL